MNHKFCKVLLSLLLVLAMLLSFSALAAEEEGDEEEEEETIAITGLSLIDTKSVTLDPGETAEISVSVVPYNATEAVKWVSDDTAVASIAANIEEEDEESSVSSDEDGSTSAVVGRTESATVTGLYPGKTAVYATSQDGKFSSVKSTVEVSGLVLKLVTTNNGITVEKDVTDSEIPLLLGSGIYIAAVGYGDAASKTWEWESDNSGVAYVERGNGTIKSAGEGTCIISCKATDGSYAAACTITVSRDESTTLKGTLLGGVFRFSTLISSIEEMCEIAYERDLVYVTNIQVSPSQGTLYYQYVDESDPGSGVGATELYYIDDSDQRQLEDVLFVPKPSYVGEASISFTIYDGVNNIKGEILIDVTQTEATDSTLSYSSTGGSVIYFKADDFNDYCVTTRGRQLRYVVFTLPTASRGVLYYNYSAANPTASTVNGYTKYYVNQSPRIDSLAFVPNTDYSGTFEILYQGWDATGDSFTGTVRISVTQDDGGITGSDYYGDLDYIVVQGSRVSLDVDDFNEYCKDETGSALDSIYFTKLPSSSQGILYYSGDTKVRINEVYYRSESPYIDNLSFVAHEDYAGTVSIPFQGKSTGGDYLYGTLTIRIQADSGSRAVSIVYTTSGEAVPFRTEDFTAVCNPKLKGIVSRVQFATPDNTAGTFYRRYISPSAASRMNTSMSVTAASLSSVYFLPKAGFSGSVYVDFTAWDQLDNRCSGTLRIDVTLSTTSAYFSDMTDASWATQSVDFLKRYGVVNGKTLNTYAPNETLKRGAYVLMLSRAFNFPSVGTYSFNDVPRDSYYAEALGSAKTLGIIGGDASGNFYPEAGITRQQAAAMLYLSIQRMSATPLEAGTREDLSGFPDSSSVSNYAVAGFGALVREGVFLGTSDGKLEPQRTLTRAEMAVILHRALTL